MYARQIKSEDVCELKEVRKVIKRNQEDKLYYAVQKGLGLISVGISAITPIILNGDATISLFTFPLGMYLIFTKGRCIC